MKLTQAFAISLSRFVAPKFRYNDTAGLAIVEAHLSRDRLTQYLQETGNDLKSATRLYVWNTELLAAFHWPLQALEVGFRNALNVELCRAYSPPWYDNKSFLALDSAQPEPRLNVKIAEAKQKLVQHKKLINTPDMVAALDFGFWTYLLSKFLEPTLWAPALHRAFPRFAAVTGKVLTRPPVARGISGLREFRNRVSHHEPIFYRDLRRDYGKVLAVCSWLDVDVRPWIEHHSTLDGVLASKPRFG